MRRPFAELRWTLARIVCGAILATLVSEVRADYSISNNLGATSGGVETATGSTWLTAGFGSGATGGTLRSVTMALINRGGSGQAEVSIYSDDALQPGSLVGSLALSGNYSTSLATNTTFTASGITLLANTNYWVVLKAVSGQFDWSWTTSTAGTGAGYQGTWGQSDDSGATWFTYDSYPTRMNVVFASAATVPEPGTWLLWSMAGVGVVMASRNRADRSA